MPFWTMFYRCLPDGHQRSCPCHRYRSIHSGYRRPAVFTFSKGSLHFTHFRLHLRELGQACYNGSSEMISQLSNAIVTFLFNIVIMRLAGEQGVAANSILLYGQFLFNAFYLGFSIGIGPIVGFQYGAGNKKN